MMIEILLVSSALAFQWQFATAVGSLIYQSQLQGALRSHKNSILISESHLRGGPDNNSGAQRKLEEGPPNSELVTYGNNSGVQRKLEEGPPNSELVTYGFNILLGQTPSEQRHDLRGSKLFELTGSRGIVNDFNQFQEFSDMSVISSCFDKGISKHIYWATSSSSLKGQTEITSNGFAREVDIGIGVPLGSSGASVSAETTIRNALLFSNSQTSIKAFQERDSGHTYSFDAKTSRSIYNIEVDYSSVSSWTQSIQDACESLGHRPTTETVLQFFERHGTHGLATARFGQSCTLSVFMKSGQSMTEYTDFHSEISSYDASFWGFSSTGSSSTVRENLNSDKYGFAFAVAQRHCDGDLAENSDCGPGKKGTGRNAPTIIEWTYKPIWEMDIPTLSSGAKDVMIGVFKEVLEASIRCMDTHCNSNGACATRSTRMANIDHLFDGSRCFCFDDFEGSQCDRGRSVRLDLPDREASYANEYDGDLTFSQGDKPLCGVSSTHSNFSEDRIFKFYTCPVNEPGKGYSVVAGSQTTHRTWWDEEWTLLCEEDKVMTALQSCHSNQHEDRRWIATCKHFKGTRTQQCEDFPNSFENDFNEYLDFKCSVGKALVGIRSVHNNHHEDRKFKFKCCELQVEQDAETTMIKSDWTDYYNNWDGKFEAFREGEAFCGISSKHWNDKEDRRYRFKFCKPRDNIGGVSTGDKWVTSSSYDEKSSVNCPPGTFVYSIKSQHSNSNEDRRFTYRCREFQGYTTDMCMWTSEVNYFDQAFDFECGTQHVITGIESYHDNYYEDRRFKLKCCRLKLSHQ